ncbi:hypothetical protein [Nonomuraea lactucae]|uniref:hypothetical protein n=1 Tax=Nonomuraea lactucae TaxID=2249762 RepID=UPI0013B4063A|nr:hypothetical protein [Nonomuraea lactucae]
MSRGDTLVMAPSTAAGPTSVRMRPTHAGTSAADDRVVVVGTRGVSLFALQLAQVAGAACSRPSSSRAKGERLRQVGAAGVVTMTDPGWPGRLAELSGGSTKVVNTVGAGITNKCLCVAIGSARMHGDLSDFIQRHGIHPVIDRRIPFHILPEVYQALGSLHLFGKVVIDVTGSTRSLVTAKESARALGAWRHAVSRVSINARPAPDKRNIVLTNIDIRVRPCHHQAESNAQSGQR